MTTAEIITIGTELLLGETSDTNTRHIAKTLRGLGVNLFRTGTVGDNAGRIAGMVGEALQRAEIVITTGGLGPTVDDPTRQAIAIAAGVELEFHPELWEQIVARIGRYGRTPTENQKRQAYIPQGAIVIENRVGTAPAFIVEMPSPLAPLPMPGEGKRTNLAHLPMPGEGERAIICLPGVPREMETLLAEAVVPYLQERFHLHEVIAVRTLHVSGIGEGALDDRMGDLEELENPTVGLTAHSGIVDVRIAAKAATPGEAAGLIAGVEADLRGRLGEDIFGADEETLEGVALQAVAQRNWRLACYESGLEGALLRRLAGTGSLAFRGGEKGQRTGETLMEAVERIRQKTQADVILTVELDAPGGMAEARAAAEEPSISISMVIITPHGRQERQMRYGGHPGLAVRWASNNALDWLRRIAREIG